MKAVKSDEAKTPPYAESPAPNPAPEVRSVYMDTGKSSYSTSKPPPAFQKTDSVYFAPPPNDSKPKQNPRSDQADSVTPMEKKKSKKSIKSVKSPAKKVSKRNVNSTRTPVKNSERNKKSTRNKKDAPQKSKRK